MGQTTEMTPAALVRGADFVAEEGDPLSDTEGMERLTYPKGSTAYGMILGILSTAWYHLASLLIPGRRSSH